MVASKNVSILVRDENDLSKYTKERYIWACLIALEWFKQIREVDAAHLKTTLEDVTLMGEYCGNPKYQHVMTYAEVSIIWYAIVKKNSPERCLPVGKALTIFKHFKF